MTTDHAPFYAEVGRLIRRAREASGLTQEELASQVSLTRTSVTNIEKGRQKLLLHTIIDIAAALRVAPAELLPGAAATGEAGGDLEELIKGRPRKERAWIRAVVGSSRKV